MMKDSESEGQGGVCGKILKALNNVTSVFGYFSRNPKSGRKPKVAAMSDDHQRNDPAKATKFELVVHQQNDQNLCFASNSKEVVVEYNHSSVDTEIPKSTKTEASDDLQNQDYRFSRYIHHVKNKIMCSFDDDDDDEVSHYVHPSKFNTTTTAIASSILA
ncbi:hypothetical protein HAX54_049125 [Datura stramonium]|uniref:Uncharacterized protein n=1 Tax=Datura stramonium TaxID=4076 RepID=A0ABS8SVC6_DATST|nr:hypothetical protein [Datura stramonium]